ncbi:hypothetical protein GH714_032322 [Hevea brasiliensis]|uniref:Uncharacterized protein n=1 Tax=Hevea brasiliensis TaxID=3981 RepID=A0A6A6LET0_HEVBR|nr:hypothetical protein GH714_032322 [Hevea brasiliensis]
MTNLADHVDVLERRVDDVLERRVDDVFALIDNCPTYEASTKELEVAHLSLEQQNKYIEVLEDKVEQLMAVVAKLIRGEDELIELEDIQNSLPTNITRLGDMESRVLTLEAERSRGYGEQSAHIRGRGLSGGGLCRKLESPHIAHDSLVGNVNDMEDVTETVKTLQG